MTNRIDRHRCRTMRDLIRYCTATILITLILCTSINTYADYKLHTTLRQVDKQQTDTLNTLMWHRVSTEPESIEPRVEPEPQVVSLGEFRVTHYDACKWCCGKTDGITKTGTKATAGRTIGVDPEVIPFGSTVYIDGQIYVAEDTGAGINGNRIDMFVDSHQEAIEKGVYTAEVFMEVVKN